MTPYVASSEKMIAIDTIPTINGTGTEINRGKPSQATEVDKPRYVSGTRRMMNVSSTPTRLPTSAPKMTPIVESMSTTLTIDGGCVPRARSKEKCFLKLLIFIVATRMTPADR